MIGRCFFFALIFTVKSFEELKFINVVFCTDDGFIAPTAVALGSMFENANANTAYHVYFLTPPNMNTENKAKIHSLEKKYEKNTIEFVDMGKKIDHFQNLLTGRFPGVAFYYLLTPSLLPHVKKLIYLDGDIIVRHDLSQLFDVNMDGYYIAGVRDGGQDIKGHLLWRVLNLTDFSHYINAGVVLLNLEKIREDNLEDKFLKLIKAQTENILNGKLIGAQDIINPVCFGKILLLPIKFNVQMNLIKIFKPYRKSEKWTPADWKEAKNATIAHFAGHRKPWVRPKKTIYHEEFWVYAKKSPFVDEIEKMVPATPPDDTAVPDL